MTRRLLLSCALALLAACTQAPPPQTISRAATAERPRRVVLVSFDGLGADQLMAQRDLPAFTALATDGAVARVIPVNPTATSSTHTSILTGADPQKHGIVANLFHLPGTPPESTAHGMEADLSVETLVEAARRQGKRVGVVTFPTLDHRNERRSGDFGMIWTMPLVRARMIHLTGADFHRDWVPPGWTRQPQRRPSFSAIMRSRLEWSVPAETLRADVDLAAYDTTDDGVENYDTFAVEVDGNEVPSDPHGWFAISKRGPLGLTGSWSKITGADASLAGVDVYWGAISRTQAYPESYRELLDSAAGFYPGPAEERENISPQLFIDQSRRLEEFLTAAATATIQRMPFDLLLAYQPNIDSASHEYLGREGGDTVIHEAFVASDRAVAAIRGALTAADALVVTGDHGLAALDREVHVGRLLADGGFAPRWKAYASGNIAHLYRFAAPDDSDAVVKALQATGVFERVEKKNAAMHPNSGDIVATAFPSVALTSSERAPAIVPFTGGNHGGLNTHREFHTILFAVGPGTPPAPMKEISQIRIARFVSQLLGITPPAAAQ